MLQFCYFLLFYRLSVVLSLIGFICYLLRIRMLDNSEDPINITGADVDPAGYAGAPEDFEAQGKTTKILII